MTEDLMRYLSERKAALSSESLEDLRRLLSMHKSFQDALAKLAKRGFVFLENVDSTLPFDYWIRKDTLGLLVFLELSREQFLAPSEHRLAQIERTLRQYPDFQGIMLVCLQDSGVKSVVLSWAELVRLRETKTSIRPENLKTIEDSISQFFGPSERPVGETLGRAGAGRRLLTADFLPRVKRMVEEEYRNLATKGVRLPHRKRAIERISLADVERLANLIALAIQKDLGHDQLSEMLEKMLRGEQPVD